MFYHLKSATNRMKRWPDVALTFQGLSKLALSPPRLRSAYQNGWAPFGRESKRWIDVLDAWDLSDQYWQSGYYSRAVTLRREILDNVVSLQTQTHPYSGPQVLSAGWASNIGHLGWLAMYAGAIDAQLLPKGKRSLAIGPTVGNIDILDSLSQNFSPVELTDLSGPIEHPALWPLVERLAMVFDGTQFIDTYVLWERYFRVDHSAVRSPFHISSEYTQRSRLVLKGLGLPADAKFVSLHIRTSKDPLDPRLAPEASFIPAINHLIDAGFHVIHFGGTKIHNLVDHQKFINVTGRLSHSESLELFLLKESEFVLTTQSGPSPVAWMLGTPVLQTNTNGIGRNLCSAGTNSLFLPKHHFRSGQRLSFNQILDSPQAYWEPSSLKSIPANSRPKPNTSTEILAAVREMMTLLSSGKENSSDYQMKIDLAREQHGAVSFGRISDSFLETHGKWFLA